MNIQKSTLESKLRNYSLLAGTLIAAGNAADAQIFHHRLNPPVVLNTDSSFFSLDLNGDGVQDYVFAEFQGKYSALAAMGLANTNSIVGSVKQLSSYKLAYPYVLSTGNKIASSNKWFNLADFNNSYSPILASSYGGSIILHHGRWDEGETAKFVGVKIKKGGKNYYGWVRITIPTLSARSITILDYAYQTTAETSILAGDTGSITGVHLTELQNVSIYASGKNVFVKYPGAATTAMNIVVSDVEGREVYSAQTNNELYELNLNNEAAGAYIVTVRSGDAQDSKKVVIQ